MIVEDSLKKIVIVTEEPLRENSLGFGRTLTNIFKNFPKASLLFYVPVNNYENDDYKVYSFPYLTFGFKRKFCKRKRWYAKYINYYYSIIQYSSQVLRKNKDAIKLIQQFNPSVLLIVPMEYGTLLEGKILARALNIPYFVYLMDDTFNGNLFHWGGTQQKIIKDLLSGATGWLMISDLLKATLESRYQIKAKKNYIIHNPVEINPIINNQELIHKKNYFQIAYAGSIHDFHADSLINVAQAIYELRNEGIQIFLTVYTRNDFWESYADLFNKYNVINGGFIPYQELFKVLNNADLLLCTTSFKESHKKIVESSVFTKITDYMAAQKPVWSIGPIYAANNLFLKKNNLGFVTDTNDINLIKISLLKMLNEKDNFYNVIAHQNSFLQKKYSHATIMDELLKFLLE